MLSILTMRTGPSFFTRSPVNGDTSGPGRLTTGTWIDGIRAAFGAGAWPQLVRTAASAAATAIVVAVIFVLPCGMVETPLRRAARVYLVEVPVSVIRPAATGPLPHQSILRRAGLAAEKLSARARTGEAPATRMMSQAAGVGVIGPLVGVRDCRAAAGTED